MHFCNDWHNLRNKWVIDLTRSFWKLKGYNQQKLRHFNDKLKN